jgi:hypothetical protein
MAEEVDTQQDTTAARADGGGQRMVDSDQDGAPDDVERFMGTNPEDDPNSDVDGDGLTHAEEAQFHSDPSRADADGDGLNDAEERALDTKPFSRDSDGDGLSDKEELDTRTDPRNIDSDGDGTIDFVEIAAKTDPNDGTQGGSGRFWGDTDTDKDGIVDAEEVRGKPGSAYRTDPLNPDSDGDGKTDGREAELSSLPNEYDPDFGKDPLDWDADGVPNVAEGAAGLSLFSQKTFSDVTDKEAIVQIYEARKSGDPIADASLRDLYQVPATPDEARQLADQLNSMIKAGGSQAERAEAILAGALFPDGRFSGVVGGSNGVEIPAGYAGRQVPGGGGSQAGPVPGGAPNGSPSQPQQPNQPQGPAHLNPDLAGPGPGPIAPQQNTQQQQPDLQPGPQAGPAAPEPPSTPTGPAPAAPGPSAPTSPEPTGSRGEGPSTQGLSIGGLGTVNNGVGLGQGAGSGQQAQGSVTLGKETGIGLQSGGAGGGITTTTAGGSTTVYPDGRIVYKDKDGNVTGTLTGGDYEAAKAKSGGAPETAEQRKEREAREKEAQEAEQKAREEAQKKKEEEEKKEEERAEAESTDDKDDDDESTDDDQQTVITNPDADTGPMYTAAEAVAQQDIRQSSVVNPTRDPNQDAGGEGRLDLPGGGYTDPLGDDTPPDQTFDAEDLHRLVWNQPPKDNVWGGEDGDGDLSGGPQLDNGLGTTPPMGGNPTTGETFDLREGSPDDAAGADVVEGDAFSAPTGAFDFAVDSTSFEGTMIGEDVEGESLAIGLDDWSPNES